MNNSRVLSLLRPIGSAIPRPPTMTPLEAQLFDLAMIARKAVRLSGDGWAVLRGGVVSVTRFSGKAVVASWRIQLGGGNPSLASELLQRFVDGTALHLDIDQPCYFRVLVREPGDTDALCDEIAAVITRHAPAARVTTRVVTAPELGEGIDAEHHGRYKAAAESLWKLLDDIDTADDAARKDDARYRATARTIAKRRSEHAQSFDGQTLVWSWDSPLQPADMAKLEIKVLHGKATDDEIAEYKRLGALHEPSPELPPEFYDGTSAAAEKGLTSEDVAGALEHKGLLISQDEPAPYRLGDFTKHDPAVITVSQFAAQFGVSPEQVTVEDGKFSVAVPAEGGTFTLYTCPEQKPTPADVANALEAADPANPDFAPALDLLADAELPAGDDCPECDGTGEQGCSSEADDG
jgi:hypothetical protein